MKFKANQKVKSIKYIGNKRVQIPIGTKGVITAITYKSGITRPYDVKFDNYPGIWHVAENEIASRLF